MFLLCVLQTPSERYYNSVCHIIVTVKEGEIQTYTVTLGVEGTLEVNKKPEEKQNPEKIRP
jgi:hypothetical protein